MKTYNELPHLLQCLKKWEKRPSAEEFWKVYLEPIRSLLEPMLDDFGARWGHGLYTVLEGLNWEAYRAEALTLDPAKEEVRLLKHMKDVEKLLGITLKGEVVLFGAFTAMDGYARFEKGTHRVFLGVDESHGRGAYLDILLTHELAHVARESIANVWEGFGLNPKMTHDEFVEEMPVVEHLMSEGYSCVISEVLNPGEDPWNYAYQSEETLAQILDHGPAVDRMVHDELLKPDGDYGNLYDVSQYAPPLPRFAHYVWAWQWVKQLLKTVGKGDPKKLLGLCSKDLRDDALAFKLKKLV